MPDWLRPTDICVVTGGCNGLGAAILKRLGEAGCQTVALDIATPNDEVEEKLSTVGHKSNSEALSNVRLDGDGPGTGKLKHHFSAGNYEGRVEAESDWVSSRKTRASENAAEEATATETATAPGDAIIPQFEGTNAGEDTSKPSLVIKCDVRSQEDLARARALIFEKFQRYPSVLVCNAGVRRPLNSIANTEFEDIEETIEVNLSGPMKCMRTFLPDILEAKRGFVVTVGSALGLICPKGLSVYGASKAGILGFHEALEQEVSVYKDVHTLLVCPGQIDTSMFADIQTPSERFAPIVEPDTLALKIVKRIKKAKTSTIYAPTYVRYLSLIRAVPTPIASLARKWSGVDKVYDGIVAERQKVAEAAKQATLSETDRSQESEPDKSQSTLGLSSTRATGERPEDASQGNKDEKELNVPRKRSAKKGSKPETSTDGSKEGTQASGGKWFKGGFFGHSSSHSSDSARQSHDQHDGLLNPPLISEPAPNFNSCPVTNHFSHASHDASRDASHGARHDAGATHTSHTSHHDASTHHSHASNDASASYSGGSSAGECDAGGGGFDS